MSESDASSGSDLIVAIDGPAGVGKSSLAARLAAELGIPYVNTGLMYRAVARRALDASVNASDGPRLAGEAASIGFSLSEDTPSRLLIDGEDPGPSLSSPEIEAIVSEVARHPEVRSVLRHRQRDLGEAGAVMEGRDIGTVVFPEAPVKIFLQAPHPVRADRRVRERGAAAGVGDALARRDALDARTNPLTPAPDAHVVDTTGLSEEEVFERALEIVRGRLHRAGRGGIAHLGPIRVAVLGRQNVGKSTLVNRMIGRKVAIADEAPGVTRDRLELEVRWGGRSFLVVDTGGFTVRPGRLERAAADQAVRVLESADLVLMVVDVQAGLQQEDADLAGRLRRASTPVVVVANKVDSERQEPLATEFYKLGLGEPLPVSALHGRGSGELLDRIVDLTPTGGQAQLDAEIAVSLVGRPNVGKSSLFNRLVREERALVDEVAGTTRDAVDFLVDVEGRTLRFVDTAGLRRQVKTQGVEYYGLLRTHRAIEASQVALLVVDASEGVTGDDKRIAARVAEAGRGLVVVLNKWDLVPSEERGPLFLELRQELSVFPGTPVLKASALTGSGVHRVVRALLGVHEAWTLRVPTSEVNRVLEAAVAAHPPPRGVGKIRYGTQVGSGPPAFVLFGSGLPGGAYRRYLENTLRRTFGFYGVPVRISFRNGGSDGRGRKARAGRATRSRTGT